MLSTIKLCISLLFPSWSVELADKDVQCDKNKRQQKPRQFENWLIYSTTTTTTKTDKLKADWYVEQQQQQNKKSWKQIIYSFMNTSWAPHPEMSPKCLTMATIALFPAF